VAGVRLCSSNQDHDVAGTMAYQLFGDRLMFVDVEGSLTDFEALEPGSIKPRFGLEGKMMELLVVKHHTVAGGVGLPFRGPRKHRATLWYVATSIDADKGEALGWLKQRLEMLADFGSLPLSKQAARMELLFTPAIKKRGAYLIDTCFIAEDVELIEDSGGDGCGFVPRGYIEKLLGNREVGKRTFGLQVRIFVPTLGIFKGMLMEKDGISEIQLPTSTMQKVDRSIYDEASPEGTLLVKGAFPSQHNYSVARILRGEEPAKAWAPSSGMQTDIVPHVLEDNGVPRGVVSEYRNEMGNIAQTRDWEKLTHSYVVGVADPTGSIPEGHIVVPGLTSNRDDLNSLFVTRCPCIRRGDGRLLPLVTSRPDGMSAKDWNFLESLHFGCVIFGNSKNGKPELASSIPDGVLDEDLYFILWNKEMLSYIEDATADVDYESDARGGLRKVAIDAQSGARRPDWLQEAQETMIDLKKTVQRSEATASRR